MTKRQQARGCNPIIDVEAFLKPASRDPQAGVRTLWESKQEGEEGLDSEG